MPAPITAPPAAIACASLASLQILQEDRQRRHRLMQNIAYFQGAIKSAGLPIAGQQTPIQPVVFKDIDSLMQAQQQLESAGLIVGAIRPPTAPRPMLRITLSSEHQCQHIDMLVDALSAVVNGG